MPRRPQSPGSKGSLKWMQDLVNLHPDVLGDALGLQQIEWLSPMANDEYAEYWDDEFLTRLGIRLEQRSLPSFWPRSGPRWDALGRIPGGGAVIVEAKAHVLEMASASRAGTQSRQKIQNAFDEVCRAWHLRASDAWFDTYYQYANRLAHAYLLNELNPTPTFLVFLHFIGAPEMGGPTTRAAWEEAIGDVQRALDVENRLPPYVLDAFIDVSGPTPVAV
jgi:hypothetical protein